MFFFSSHQGVPLVEAGKQIKLTDRETDGPTDERTADGEVLPMYQPTFPGDKNGENINKLITDIIFRKFTRISNDSLLFCFLNIFSSFQIIKNC